MTGPREELEETGRIGASLAELLYRTVAVVGVSRRFPPPEGSTAWDQTAVADTAHALIDGERGAKRLADALLRSTDEDSFARQIEGATVNFLRDLARQTDFGKVVRRVTEILREEEQFTEHLGAPARFGLADGPDSVSGAGPAALARSAGLEADVAVPAWKSERRDAPIADRPSIVRILLRILHAADGTITAVEAAHAVAARIDVRRTPLTVEVGVLERLAEPADPAVAAAVSAEARRLFEALDDRERIVIASYGEPWEGVADRLALKRSTVMLLRQRVVRRLQAELDVVVDEGGGIHGGDELGSLVVQSVRELCLGWTEGRT